MYQELAFDFDRSDPTLRKFISVSAFRMELKDLSKCDEKHNRTTSWRRLTNFD